jgi:Pentapeptide repeats (8 copies)
VGRHLSRSEPSQPDNSTVVPTTRTLDPGPRPELATHCLQRRAVDADQPIIWRTQAYSPNVLHVLKHWAAWPRGIRWLAGGIAALLLALVLAWVLFVPAADWLAHHDVGSVKGSLHEMAVDNARGRLLTLGAGLFAAGALIFTARNFTLSRRTFRLTEQGQVTDRYTKAVEQLGSDKLDVRIGGIYALERVARDSARDHPTVMEVLTAFIREHSREHWPPPDHPADPNPTRSIRPDVQAAVTVVGRRDVERDIRVRPIDLTSAHLDGAHLAGAHLGGVHLNGAHLGGAWLDGADLTRATLTGAHLTGAHLGSAHLGGAWLNGADLTHADFRGAGLGGANLTGADLSGAWLGGAWLGGADLSGATLTGADFRGADLSGADLTAADFTDADLTRATLTGARFTGARFTGAKSPEGAPVPEGWERDTSSGRLKQAGTDSGPTEAN